LISNYIISILNTTRLIMLLNSRVHIFRGDINHMRKNEIKTRWPVLLRQL